MEGYQTAIQTGRIGTRIVTVIAIVCNLIVVAIFVAKKQLRVKYYAFLFNLVFSDIVHATVALIYFSLGGRLMSAIFRTTFFVTELSVLAVAVNRWMALSILPPARYDVIVTPLRMLVTCVLFWLVSAAIYIPTTYAFDVPLVTRFIRPLFALIILIVTSILYWIVFRKITEYRTAQASEINEQRQTRLDQTKRLMVTFSIILAVTFLCWIPHCTCQVIMYFNGTVLRDETPLFQVVFFYTLALLMLNSAVNPFIYFWRFPEFRCCREKEQTAGANTETVVESTTAV